MCSSCLRSLFSVFLHLAAAVTLGLEFVYAYSKPPSSHGLPPPLQVMMDWLAQLCGLPERFMHRSGTGGGGVIQGTSSEAVAVALLAAQCRAMRGRPPGDKLKLVAYSSDQVGPGIGTSSVHCLSPGRSPPPLPRHPPDMRCAHTSPPSRPTPASRKRA